MLIIMLLVIIAAFVLIMCEFALYIKKNDKGPTGAGEQAQGRAKRQNHVAATLIHFDPWPDSVHLNPTAQRSFERATKAATSPLPSSVNADSQSALFPSSSSDEPYHVTLSSCDCMSFSKNNGELPCKHIYRLALELGLIDFPFETGVNKNLLKVSLAQISDSVWGDYKSPSGGYINYARYRVSGIFPQTKRRRAREYDAYDKAGAILAAQADGLTEPFEVTSIQAEGASEAQIICIHNHGAKIPDDACKVDATAILTRLLDCGSSAPAKDDFATFAIQRGVRFSKYSGAYHIFRCAQECLSRVDYVSFVRASAAFFSARTYKLMYYTSSEIQDNLSRVLPCDFVALRIDSDGSSVRAVCGYRSEIGELPNTVSIRHLRSGAVAAFVDHIDSSQIKGVQAPYVTILWQ